MFIKFPKDDTKTSWTRHIKNKMVFYNISGAQILRIFSTPERREEAIAPGTIGAMRVMKHNVNKAAIGQKQKPRETELWIMYKLNAKRSAHLTSDKMTNDKTKSKLEKQFPRSDVRGQMSKVVMISAWRYPGRTKPGERPKIPEGLMDELAEEGVI